MPRGQIAYVTSDDRVIFKTGLQKRLLKLARAKLKYANWRDFANNILGVTETMVFNYLNETSKLSVTQVQRLSKICKIPVERIFKDWAVKIIEKENLLSEQGKIGSKKAVAIQLKKYGKIGWQISGNRAPSRKLSPEEIERAREYGKKGYRKLIDKYGESWFSRMARANTIKRNVKKSQLAQKPTLQERNLIDLNIKNNLEFRFHEILGRGNDWRCFDFIYYFNNKPILVEEVTSTSYLHRSYTLDLIEKKEWLKKMNLPLFVTFSKLPKKLDCVLLLIDEDIIPIFSKEERINLIFSAIRNDSYLSSNYIKNLRKFIKYKIKEKSNILLASAKRECNKISNPHEQVLNGKLNELGLNPTGKKILQTKYGTYLVPDNYFEYNGNKFCVLVSFANSHNSLRILASEHAAYAYFIKKLVDPDMKCISILGFNCTFDFINDSNSLYRKYLQKYVDIILNFNEINKLPLILNKKDWHAENSPSFV